LKLSFRPFLYLTCEHLLTQTEGTIYCFAMYRKKQSRAVAIFQCAVNLFNEWVSPPRAPFGGIQCDPDCSPQELEFLLSCISTFIARRSGKSLTIKTAPACYHPNSHSLLHGCYERNGFTAVETHANHFIPVDSDNFAEKIRPAEKRRLIKCKNAGYAVSSGEKIELEEAYGFLTHCRNQADYKIPLSLCQISQLACQLPEHLLLFGVFDADKMIALSISLKVSDDILYNFLVADHPEYRTFSPVVLLTETIYNFCRQRNISIIDLGISVDSNAETKPSLSRFKKNIGGLECEKITYRLTF
jgi:hypothetical protein